MIPSAIKTGFAAGNNDNEMSAIQTRLLALLALMIENSISNAIVFSTHAGIDEVDDALMESALKVEAFQFFDRDSLEDDVRELEEEILDMSDDEDDDEDEDEDDEDDANEDEGDECARGGTRARRVDDDATRGVDRVVDRVRRRRRRAREESERRGRGDAHDRDRGRGEREVGEDRRQGGRPRTLGRATGTAPESFRGGDVYRYVRYVWVTMFARVRARARVFIRALMLFLCVFIRALMLFL